MVVDTSALLAILQDEPERRGLTEAIAAAESRLMSVASFVEVSIVVETRHGAEGLRDLDLFLERAGIELIAVDTEQGRVARHAFSLTARDDTRRHSTSATASPTRWPASWGSRCSTGATTSAGPTSAGSSRPSRRTR